MSWTRRPEAALLAAFLLASPAIAADAAPVVMAVPEDGSVIDVRPVAELLIRHGAPIVMSALPSGRIGAVMKEPAPACGMAFVRNLGDRPELQWIAKTAKFDFVAAGLADGQDHAIGPQTTAIVAMNTLAQSVAAKAGYTVVPIRSLNQAVPLMQSGRAGIVVASQQEVDKLAAASNTPLHVETTLTHGEAWMACNRFVEQADLDRLLAAWNEVLASGELREFYIRADIMGLYPE